MPDPAPETDRKLVDRLLPGWRIVTVGPSVRVERLGFHSQEFEVPSHAIQSAATALRAILARDRETRGEAEPETPPPLRRVPVQIVSYMSEDQPHFGALANDGTMWREATYTNEWYRVSNLPQPGEDGGA